MRICPPNTSHQKSLTCRGRSPNQSVSNVGPKGSLGRLPQASDSTSLHFHKLMECHCVSSTGDTGLHMEDSSCRQLPTARAIAAPQSFKAPCLGAGGCLSSSATHCSFTYAVPQCLPASSPPGPVFSWRPAMLCTMSDEGNDPHSFTLLQRAWLSSFPALSPSDLPLL